VYGTFELISAARNHLYSFIAKLEQLIAGDVSQEEDIDGECGTHVKVQLRIKNGTKYVWVNFTDRSKRLYHGNIGFIVRYDVFGRNIDGLPAVISETSKEDYYDRDYLVSGVQIDYRVYVSANARVRDWFEIAKFIDDGRSVAAILNRQNLELFLLTIKKYGAHVV
jgi:hypothetical protein